MPLVLTFKYQTINNQESPTGITVGKVTVYWTMISIDIYEYKERMKHFFDSVVVIKFLVL